MKNIVIDIDDTICFTTKGDYQNSKPNVELIKKVQEYHKEGFRIILFTSRNMRTYKGNVGEINKNTLPIILDWMKKYDVPFDEIHVGKPWCGFEGFYVDDKAIRPDEFVDMSYSEIKNKLKL